MCGQFDRGRDGPAAAGLGQPRGGREKTIDHGIHGKHGKKDFYSVFFPCFPCIPWSLLGESNSCVAASVWWCCSCLPACCGHKPRPSSRFAPPANGPSTSSTCASTCT